MIVSIHQPSYFPWLGLLNKVAKADIFIILDEVQLSDSSFQHRNIFLDSKGNIKYLTIPLQKKGYMRKRIRDILINSNEKWTDKHYKFLFFNYKKHSYFEEILPFLTVFFKKNYIYLIDAVYESMKIVFNLLDIKTQIVFQSELNYNKNAKKGDLILELVKAVGGKTYLSGIGAKNYMQSVLNKFNKEGIKVIWNNFQHFEYPQKNSSKFVEGLSSLDLFFNVGIETAKKLFWDNVKKERFVLGI